MVCLYIGENFYLKDIWNTSWMTSLNGSVYKNMVIKN